MFIFLSQKPEEYLCKLQAQARTCSQLPAPLLCSLGCYPLPQPGLPRPKRRWIQAVTPPKSSCSSRRGAQSPLCPLWVAVGGGPVPRVPHSAPCLLPGSYPCGLGKDSSQDRAWGGFGACSAPPIKPQAAQREDKQSPLSPTALLRSAGAALGKVTYVGTGTAAGDTGTPGLGRVPGGT